MMWALMGWAAAAEPEVLPPSAIRITVVDEHQEPLSGVPLLLDDQALLSDERGEAWLRTEAGPHTLTVSLPGQPPVSRTVTTLVNRTLVLEVNPSWLPEPPLPGPALTREMLEKIPTNRGGYVANPISIGIRVGTPQCLRASPEPPASIVVEHPRLAEATWVDGCLVVRGLKPGRTRVWTTRPDGRGDVDMGIVVLRPDEP